MLGDEPTLEELISQEKQNSTPKPVVLAAVGGFVVGILLWGSVVLAFVGWAKGIADVPNRDSGSAGSNAVTEAPSPTAINCDAYGPVRALSPEQEAAYQRACVTPADSTLSATNERPSTAPVTTRDEAETAPSAQQGDRVDCEEIRGTEYRSMREREWFLEHCVNASGTGSSPDPELQ